MPQTIENEISRFSRLANSLDGKYTVTSPCSHSFVITPVTSKPSSTNEKKSIPLALMALTHGCEFAGVSVLNEILTMIADEKLKLEFPVAFILGNPEAALENKRFLDSDLNRSFNKEIHTNHEEKRALELESTLQKTALILDIHQTLVKSLQTFFIFPWSIGGYNFARAIDPAIPIVTHKSSFSADGMCTDEYVNKQGGAGITLELGQNGFDPTQIKTGVKGALSAVAAVTAVVKPTRNESDATMYTWGEIIKWPCDESGPINNVSLDPDWCNFKPISKGERIGQFNNTAINSTVSGMVLFPKYIDTSNIAPEAIPSELCRVICPITKDYLPEIN